MDETIGCHKPLSRLEAASLPLMCWKRDEQIHLGLLAQKIKGSRLESLCLSNRAKFLSLKNIFRTLNSGLLLSLDLCCHHCGLLPMSSKMQENEVSNYAGPPPAYHELNHDTGGENPGDQAGSSESSSRRRAGLFPAPPPIDAQQRTVTQGNRSPQNNPFSNTNRPANDMSGPSTSNPQQPPAGYAYSNINLDESNSARGLAGSAIQKGVRLAQKLNPLGHNR